VDSATLLKRRSYAHSAALSVFCLEELAKSVYCYFAHKGWVNMQEFHKYMRDHARKLEVLASSEVFMTANRLEELGRLEAPSSFMDMAKPIEKAWKNIGRIRNMALYVDYESQVSPLHFNKRLATRLLTIATYWSLQVGTIVKEQLPKSSQGTKLPFSKPT
jgi:AbiV family abortive infection protein